MITIRKEENVEELWKLYLQTGDAEYRERLINHYLYLVKIALGRFIYNLPSFIERDDLEGYGIIGLMQAFERYQPEKGLKFETYALSRIRGAALDYLRSLDPMTRGQRKKFKEVMATWYQLQSEKGKEPTLEEISNEMGISVQDISWIIEQNRTGIFFSLDQEKGEEGRELFCNSFGESGS
jgi:RNA polymerase sigma factor for flagellar operon FliA